MTSSLKILEITFLRQLISSAWFLKENPKELYVINQSKELAIIFPGVLSKSADDVSVVKIMTILTLGVALSHRGQLWELA
jgi:hypothetical protein